MYFKKLELFGFKSFAEKTTLHFEPGITAVVGPNGCGKSNVFDSIRWVLGEQSVKSLRGSKMEDVIFNGTENIPALGYAEVSLTFANEKKALPIDYDEVTVTRRLFRSGESEYLINKTQVRLKDILELFMGTGIGAESYSLIEQGKIDLILSSRPEDRRLVFDEAAGISKYKSQKREAMRKLEDTEQNLLRINDIILEVKRQINSLERQAAKARRYKEVFERLKSLESEVSAFQLKQYQEKQDELNQQLSQSISLESQTAQEIEQLNSEEASQQNELRQLEEKINSLRARIADLENTISYDSQQLGFNHERVGESQKRILAIDEQRKAVADKLSQDEAKINGLKEALDALIQALTDKKALQSDSQDALAGITKELELAKTKLQEAKAKILEFAASEAGLNNQILELTSGLNQAIARKKRLQIEKLKTEEEFKAIQNDLTFALQQEDAAKERFTLLEGEFKELKALYDCHIQKSEDLKKRLQDMDNERLSLESQKEFLCNLRLKYENISESSNALVLLDSLADYKISGMIVKIDEVQEITVAQGDPACQMRFKARGVAKPISLDPQEIINKIENLSHEIARDSEALGKEKEIVAELASRISDSEKIMREAEIEYHDLKAKKDNVQVNHKRLGDELELIGIESQEISGELEGLEGKQKSLQEELAQVKRGAQNNQQEIERCLEAIASKECIREKALVSLTQLNVEISAYEEKASDARKTLGSFEETHLKDKAFASSLAGEENSLHNRISELEVSSGQLEQEIEGSRRQKELKDSGVQDISSSLGLAENKLKSTQGELGKRKEALDGCKVKIHELQMQLQELTFQQSSILERIQQVYKMSPEELKSALNPQLNREEAEREIEILKTKINSYGQVNLVAIEEFDELRQRHDFLTTQAEDLLRSKESLQEAILKINRTTKKMFLETFEKLAIEFKNYFRMLFGGGDAQLFLLDEQDVLESGIEIVCRPPGKKLQNVLLLSGGEKSMSAIALLFAIFKVKPSPFCVLDEIDAALDEANVDRFSLMLFEFTSQSQFIVITHNKKTIARANIMYGITMEKAGISKIVSVKLAENTRKEIPAQENPQAEEKALSPA